MTKDLIKAQLDGGPPLLFEVSDVTPEDVDTDSPRIRFTDADGNPQVLECDVVAGTDGFHGVSRPVVQQGTGGRSGSAPTPTPGWASWPTRRPPTDELIYAWHPEGFALYSMRSPKVSRLYLQVDPDEKIEDWSDDRIWDNLATRFALEGWELQHRARSPRSRCCRCARSSAPRCAAAGCSSPATPRTSCRRPAPRASTSPSPT